MVESLWQLCSKSSWLQRGISDFVSAVCNVIEAASRRLSVAAQSGFQAGSMRCDDRTVSNAFTQKAADQIPFLTQSVDLRIWWCDQYREALCGQSWNNDVCAILCCLIVRLVSRTALRERRIGLCGDPT